MQGQGLRENVLAALSSLFIPGPEQFLQEKLLKAFFIFSIDLTCF